jgi:3-deoxy-D-arabino-heptulosonate 7-phosphate (DAHP) synthase
MSLAKSALKDMNTSMNQSTKGRFVVSEDTAQMADEKYGFIAHVFFGVIAILAFAGNFLICVVILRKKRLLSKQYNILILNLAVTDLLTGEL